MNVLFPLMLLQPAPEFVDPSNTNTIYEYYLLENLGAGLVRDSQSDMRGYRPVLAESWRQESPKKWAFILRSGLVWSDGSPMTGQQIAKHFMGFRGHKSRHLRQLTQILSASFDESTRSLSLMFDSPTNSGLLHELALADTVVVYPGPERNWLVTSGPYSIEAYHPAEPSLILKLNPSNPLATSASPAKIRLFWLDDEAKRTSAITNGLADIFYVPGFRFLKRIQALMASSAQRYEGCASTVSFFYFNEMNPLSRDPIARQEFAYLIHQAVKKLDLPSGMEMANQFIPQGYPGRLASYREQLPAVQRLRGQSLVVSLTPAFKAFPTFADHIVATAAANGVAITVRYQDFLDADGTHGEFALYSSFRGNQSDPVGSWSYLFSPDLGPLRQFSSETQRLFTNVGAAASESERLQVLSVLHRLVLDKAFAVPFWMEAPAILASERIDLSAINRFDLRMRFYEMAWK